MRIKRQTTTKNWESIPIVKGLQPSNNCGYPSTQKLVTYCEKDGCQIHGVVHGLGALQETERHGLRARKLRQTWLQPERRSASKRWHSSSFCFVGRQQAFVQREAHLQTSDFVVVDLGRSIAAEHISVLKYHVDDFINVIKALLRHVDGDREQLEVCVGVCGPGGERIGPPFMLQDLQN